MSQPTKFGPLESDPLGLPLSHVDELIKLFKDTEKPKEKWLMGIEYEMFGQVQSSNTPLPYDGKTSIQSLFQHMVLSNKDSLNPFHPILEDNTIVALKSEQGMIALEPGGQLEIAASPRLNISDAILVVEGLVLQLKQSANHLGIDVFALGLHPVAERNEMAFVKKARYGIMRNYMKGLSGLGLDMMTRSAAIQINLDFSNERDMARKAKLGACLVPFFSLLSSSASFVGGKMCSHALERAHIWRQTDPLRTGMPSIIFQDDFGYASWVNFVLDVPMYFVRRDETYHNVAGASFRKFMADGLLGFRATIRDFVDHMSTVFTEIRLKPFIELRSFDSLPLVFVKALGVLAWALFYNENALAKTLDIFDGITHKELFDLQDSVISDGIKARFRGHRMHDINYRLLVIAKEEADKIKESDGLKLSEALVPLQKLVEKNLTCAQWIKDNFAVMNDMTLTKLVKEFDPFNNPIEQSQ